MTTRPRADGINLDAPYWVSLAAAERRIIQGAWDQAKNANDAAALLGISHSFYRRRALVLGLNLGIMGRPRTRQRSPLPMRVPEAETYSQAGEDET
jgi:hypothetical protein